MTPDELLRNEAAKWLRQAAKDRNTAQVLVSLKISAARCRAALTAPGEHKRPLTCTFERNGMK